MTEKSSSPSATRCGVPSSYNECLEQQASAWMSVVELLNELAPGWSLTNGGSGIDMAVAAIRKLCAPSEIPRKTDQEPCAWRYKEHTEQVGWRYSEKSPTEPWAIEIEPLYSLPWWAPFVPSAIAPSNAPDEDGERYRWFRDECDQNRRIEILEVAGEYPEMLDHHIDKGRCGL